MVLRWRRGEFLEPSLTLWEPHVYCFSPSSWASWSDGPATKRQIERWMEGNKKSRRSSKAVINDGQKVHEERNGIEKARQRGGSKEGRMRWGTGGRKEWRNVDRQKVWRRKKRKLKGGWHTWKRKETQEGWRDSTRQMIQGHMWRKEKTGKTTCQIKDGGERGLVEGKGVEGSEVPGSLYNCSGSKLKEDS